MSERFYRLLLRLYPEDFRQTYGDEALRLVRDRARHEKGFPASLRLWLDLLTDLAISLPREYRNPPATPVLATGDLSFQLLPEPSLNPKLLFLAALVSASLIWACVTSVARTPTFPAAFEESFSLQGLVQADLALARLPAENQLPDCADLAKDRPQQPCQEHDHVAK